MRGQREIELFAQAIARQLNQPRNAAKGSWLEMPRYCIWLKIIEESFEVMTAYFALCWAEVCHERRNSYKTLLEVIAARASLGREIADLSACLLFLSDQTAALYCYEGKEVEGWNQTTS